MTGHPVESRHALHFSSLTGARYLFDSATLTVHPWPWAVSAEQLEALYLAPDPHVADILKAVGAPAEAAGYVLAWRRRAGAFGAPTAHACLQHDACGAGIKPGAPTEEWRPVPGLLSNLILVVTDECNARCKYCIFGGGYPGFHGYAPERMSLATAQKAVDRFFELNEAPSLRAMPRRKLDVAFFGGEPLLEGELIRQVVQYVEARKAVHQWVEFSASTNLTTLSEDFIDFAIGHRLGLNVSLDGPCEVHDRYRRDAGDHGTFDRVWRNLERLQRRDPRFFSERVRALVTLNGNSDLLAIRDFFESGDSTVPKVMFVSFVRDLGTGAFHRKFPFDEARFRDQYAALRIDYHRRKAAGVPVVEGQFLHHLFERPLKMLYERIMRTGDSVPTWPGNNCTPGRRLSVSPDGRIHLCERINRSFPIGNVERGIDSLRCAEVQERYRRSLPDCGRCWARGLCQFCFASTSTHDTFGFDGLACSAMRRDLAGQLGSLYALLERSPEGLTFGDVLVDRQRLAGVST